MIYCQLAKSNDKQIVQIKIRIIQLAYLLKAGLEVFGRQVKAIRWEF